MSNTPRRPKRPTKASPASSSPKPERPYLRDQLRASFDDMLDRVFSEMDGAVSLELIVELHRLTAKTVLQSPMHRRQANVWGSTMTITGSPLVAASTSTTSS